MKHMNRAALFPLRCYASRKPFVNGYRDIIFYTRQDRQKQRVSGTCVHARQVRQ